MRAVRGSDERGRGEGFSRAAREPAAGRPSAPRAPRTPRTAEVIVLSAALLRLVLAAVIPLVPDETYYWEWSRRLAGGYFDHPYGIALSIRAGTALFAALGLGPSPLAVRFVPVLEGLGASLAVVAIARRLAGAGAATEVRSSSR
jgi:hypothetical protein